MNVYAYAITRKSDGRYYNSETDRWIEEPTYCLYEDLPMVQNAIKFNFAEDYREQVGMEIVQLEIREVYVIPVTMSEELQP